MIWMEQRSIETLWNRASLKQAHTSVSASGHWHGCLCKITAQLSTVPTDLEHLNIDMLSRWEQSLLMAILL